jgi:hypothetical protein
MHLAPVHERRDRIVAPDIKKYFTRLPERRRDTTTRCRRSCAVRSAMDDRDGYFGEGVAARYDESCADMFEPGVVDTVVEVLAGLAGGGRLWSWASHCRWRAAA